MTDEYIGSDTGVSSEMTRADDVFIRRRLYSAKTLY